MFYYAFGFSDKGRFVLADTSTSSPSPDRFTDDRRVITLTDGAATVTLTSTHYAHHDVDGVYAAMGETVSDTHTLTLEIPVEAAAFTAYDWQPSGGRRLPAGVHSPAGEGIILVSTAPVAMDDAQVSKALAGLAYLYADPVNKRFSGDAPAMEQVMHALACALLKLDESTPFLLVLQEQALTRHFRENPPADAAEWTALFRSVCETILPQNTLTIPVGTVTVTKETVDKDVSRVVFPDSVKRIEEEAFFDCGNLTALTLPAGLEEIGEGAFRWCSGLEEILIPGNVQAVPYNAFTWCKSLQKAVLQEGITSIEPFAFSECGSLSLLVIPASVTFVANNIFGYGRCSCTVQYGGTTAAWQGLNVTFRGSYTVVCTDGTVEHKGE